MASVPEPKREMWTVRMKEAVARRGMMPLRELIAIGADAVPPGRGWHQIERKRRNHNLRRGYPERGPGPMSDERVYSGQRSVAHESLRQMVRKGTLKIVVEYDGRRLVTDR